jgi:hypothetical protein
LGDYDRFSITLRVLLGGQPKRVLAEHEELGAKVRRTIQQDGMTLAQTETTNEVLVVKVSS